MWIMSQDGNLLCNASAVWVCEKKLMCETFTSEPNSGWTLGEFPTHKIAIEALSLIHNWMSVGGKGVFQVR